jgi:uncharacterized protein YjiS (DUF1127 family)
MAIHAIWSTPMSTTFSQAATFPLGPPARDGTTVHQRISWAAAAAPWRLIGIWAERRSQRSALRNLLELDDHLLKDVGLTREQGFRQAGKPFWRA